MRIWCFRFGSLVEISRQQYDFIEALKKSRGAIDKARELYPVSDEQFTEWKADAVFGPVLAGWEDMLVTSTGLCEEQIKAKLFLGIEKNNLDKSQLNVLNSAMKALGVGVQQKQFKAQINPDSTTIEFNDTIIDGNN
jgi:hypothetical protein